MTSAQERLKLKRPHCETWSIREQLCLASSVLKSGDQNWMSVSRSLKPLLEKESQRPIDWFSQKSCALQYAQLLENADTPKRKKRESSETIGESIVRRLTQERMSELSQFLASQKDEYHQLKSELNLLKSGNISEEKLQKLWLAIEQEEQEQKSKVHTNWPKRQKLEGQSPQALGFNIQRKSDSSESHDTLDPNPDEEEKKNKGGRSPLLTSLLKSPSPTTQIQSQPSSAQVTSPTIASLLGSSPKIPNPQLTQNVSPQLHQLVSTAIANATPERPSAGAPTLSMLLELPANLQRTSLPNLQPRTSTTALPQQNIDFQLMQIDNQRGNIQIIEPSITPGNMSTSEIIDHIDEVIPKDIMADVIDKDEINEIIGDIEELIKGEIPDNPQVLDPGTARVIESLDLPQPQIVPESQESKNVEKAVSLTDSPESEIAIEEIDSSTSNIAEIIGTVAPEPKIDPQESKVDEIKLGDEVKPEDSTNKTQGSKNEKSLEILKDSNLKVNSEAMSETKVINEEQTSEVKEDSKTSVKEDVHIPGKEDSKKSTKEEVKKVVQEDVSKPVKEEGNKSAKEVSKTIKEVNKSTKEVKSVKEVNKSVKEVNKSVKEVNKSAKEVNKSDKEEIVKSTKDEVKKHGKEVKEEIKKYTRDELKKNTKEEVKKNNKEEVKKNIKEEVKKTTKEDIKKITKVEVKKPNKEETKKPNKEETKKPNKEEAKKCNEDLKKDSSEQPEKSVKKDTISKNTKEDTKIEVNKEVKENDQQFEDLTDKKLQANTEKQNSNEVKADKVTHREKNKTELDQLEANLAMITGDETASPAGALSISSSDTINNEDIDKSQDISLILQDDESPGKPEKKKEKQAATDRAELMASSKEEVTLIKGELGENENEEILEEDKSREFEDIKLEAFKREDTKDSDGTSNTELLENDLKDLEEDDEEEEEELREKSTAVEERDDTLKGSEIFREHEALIKKEDVDLEVKEEKEEIEAQEEMVTDEAAKSEKESKEENDDKKNSNLDESVRKEQANFSENVSELDEEESTLSKLSGGRAMKTYSKRQTIAVDSEPETEASGEGADYRAWKKAVMLVYNRLATHKYASAFLRPITEDQAPGYHSIIFRPMDLSTIKKNIDNGTIRSTRHFQRDVMLMFQNAIMYNKHDTFVYKMAITMQEECLQHMQILVQVTGEVSFRRETRTAASSSEASESGIKKKRSLITPSPHDSENPRAKKRQKSEND